MQFTLKRSGGLLGSALPPVVVDSNSLPLRRQEQIEDLVRAANFFALPANLVADSAGVDRFQFDLEIRDPTGRAHRVTFGEENAPASLLELTSAVRDAAAGRSSRPSRRREDSQ